MSPIKRLSKWSTESGISFKRMIAFTIFILTLLGASTGATLWATSEHEDLRSYTLDATTTIRADMKADNEEKFVEQKQYNKDITQLNERQTHIKRQVDKIVDILIKHR